MEMRKFAELMKSIIEKTLCGVKEVYIQNVLKNNSMHYTALVIVSKESNVAPNIYLEYYYEKYKKGTEPEILAHEIMQAYRKNRVEQKVDLKFICDWEQAKGMVAYRLINTQKNVELLKKIPHKNILDLSKVCYLSLHNGDASILIHKGLCDMWNISEEELFQAAEENTPKLFPQEIKSVNEIAEELFETRCGDSNIQMDYQIRMYLLTNTNKCMGAAVMFYPECMERIAENLRSDFYILPSSIHETIILPTAEGGSPKDLAVMVKEINAAIVDKSEVLSDSVYRYRRKQKEICIVA